MGTRPVPWQERFWSKVEKIPFHECWEWTAQLSWGYGYLNVTHSKRRRAHVLSWELSYGEVPKGLCVLHKCDNHSCVRPEHLFLGTNKDNSLDAMSKRRHAHGEKHGMVKLTESEVRKIRRSQDSQSEIGKRFGISQGTVSNIQLRKNWKYVD